MKWSVPQLEKLTINKYEFSFTCDFKNMIEKVEDILDIYEVEVNGTIEKINHGTYHFKYHIHAPLVLECALTLDPVDYIMDLDYDEVFSVEENDNHFLIENNTIDMDIVVWTNILLEKPMSVTLPNAYDILRERGIEIIEDDDSFKEE